jgi:two-component system response regulator GlrR
LLRLLSMRLKAAGYSVSTAESGERALAALAMTRPDLVITDLRMVGMDGMQLLGEIQQRCPTLPVIILTAHGTIPEAVAATKQGVFGFVSKPYDSKRLLDLVAQALDLSAGGTPSLEPSARANAWREHIITRSPLMEDLLSEAKLVANSDVSILVHGESGTGKELLAQAVHRASPRAQAPFLGVNCSAISEGLLESELFGHCKGSFTGATAQHDGLFQAAHKGSLFLDEIGDMPLSLQAKLLRVLQERKVRPVGSTESIAVDVRIISATHRDLEAAMAEGDFREDLYYRLNVVALTLPPLRDRREDIPLLAHHFLAQTAQRNRKKTRSFAPEAMELLVSASWPGNVRQLYNLVEQCAVLATTPVVSAALVEKALRAKPGEILSFAEARQRFERDYLAQLLHITGGNVSQAARMARRNRTEFYRLLSRHQIDVTQFKRPTP